MSITFGVSTEPVVDVVVLAWKNAELLRSCLVSLAASAGAPEYGVRIVLNGAEPAVRRLVADEVTGATIVDLQENVGYGLACDLGATGSAARYLVFLNDDAVADPRWLAELVAAADTGTAAVLTSLLLEPDGTIQEAGARVDAEGQPVLFGTGLTAAEAESAGLLTPREIGYGSGAGMLVRRELFESIGGFDIRYAPAYWEDVDLCLRLRGLGHTVELVPSARLTHRGNSSTADIPLFREYAVLHAHDVFQTRWAEALRAAPPAEAEAGTIGAVPALSREDAMAEPFEPRDPDVSTGVALGIQRAFADWLGRELQLARTDARETHERLDELDEHARGLATRIDELAAAIRDHVRQIDELTAERDQLKADKADLHERLAASEIRADAAERLAAEVHSSVSWKVTAPLRKLKGQR